MIGAPIREVVVAGSGLVGVAAAAMIKRRVPLATVTLVGAAPLDAVSERIGTALPSIVGFHGDLGLDETDALRSGASFRLGTRFEGWTDRPAYVHAYGEYGRPLGIGQFHQYWLRQALAGRAAPFEAHSPVAMLALAGRFVHPQGGPESPLSGFEYGLNFDPARYRELLRAYARHLGVTENPAAIAEVRVGEGGIESLRLDDGGEVAGHLFVDCTGPQALLRGRLDDRFEDWSRWLPCDRLLLGHAPGPAEPPVLDTVAAHGAGWRWQSACRALATHGLAYASAHLTDSRAERVFRAGAGLEPSGPALAIRSGRRPDPWIGNCVAIGDAAVTLEPLEWTGLHLAHSAIDRLVAKLPDRDFARVELWDYNRECGAEAERARDFAVLHYAVSDRPKDEFWRAAAAAEPPPSLAHTLRLWRERGRQPLYEEETFNRHSWAAVLLGQGVIPRRFDPLIDTVPPETSERAMAQLRDNIAAMVSAMPSQAAYIRQLAARSAR